MNFVTSIGGKRLRVIERIPIERGEFAVAFDFALDVFAVGEEEAGVEAHWRRGRRYGAAEEAQAIVRWGDARAAKSAHVPSRRPGVAAAGDE